MSHLVPPLSLETQALFRVSYGLVLLLTLLQTLPQARRFFVSDRWGGYAKSDPRVDLLQNPYVMPLVQAIWLACGVLLVAGRHTVAAALVNLLLCRYFFVAMRWKGVLRGMGAPGFMLYWTAAAVFFLEYGLRYDPTGALRSTALLAFRVDFAVIMLCAGTYKFFAGYRQNSGMELGMINPWWGYWGGLYARLSPSHLVFRTMNHLAWATEVGAGLLMLFPPTQVLGALLIMGSFVFIALHIRLAFLCENVILCGLLFIPAGHPLDRLVAHVVHAAPPVLHAGPAWLNALLRAALVAYLILLPLAKAGQYYNLLARRSLARPLQTALERYTNFFGIIIWRVFSADHTNFFAWIDLEDPTTGVRVRQSPFGRFDWPTRFRYLHVGEYITLASLFTTLKYYPSNPGLFEERILRYARTIPRPPGARVVFQYVSIRKERGAFEQVTVAEYAVDLEKGTVRERVLDGSVSVRAAIAASPVHEGMKPGSYAPAAR